MPSICRCPDCHDRVLVESLTDAVQRLRCPLCGGIFEAGTVAAEAELAPPWALPVVDEAEAATAEPAVGGIVVHDHQPGALEGALDVPADGFVEHAPYSIAEIAAAADGGSAAVDSPQPEGWPGTAGDPNPEPIWGAMREHVEEIASQPSRGRRREPQVGVLGHLIGVVLGGVVGIGLGYLVLLWMAGRQGDFLHIWDQVPRVLLPSEHVDR